MMFVIRLENASKKMQDGSKVNYLEILLVEHVSK